MDLNDKELRLKQILDKTINEEKIGTAIAITGSWGVGKTFFWNKFRQTYPFKNKYVYVSLFGLESLGDLKTHIYTNIENNHSAIEIPRWIRGLPSILKDTRISQFGINASAKVFDSLMFNQVKDAIICFDDFERMSNKLDIKDVMGLANQLKLERNCQIILILDESKTEDKNKEKYVEYKEKLIDETIKIISVEPLIRANTTDIEDDLVNLMVRFADELEIHNFRFFQKVIKQYRKFRDQLPKSVADSTKKIILVRILQGHFIEDFGEKYEYKWEDVKYVVDKQQIDWSKIKLNTYKKLESISYEFIHSDGWLIEFRKWFDQKGDLNLDELRLLVNSELISEEKNSIRDQLRNLMEQWRNLEVNSDFINNLHKNSLKSIGNENLENLDFYCTLLSLFSSNTLSNDLQANVEKWIFEQFNIHGNGFVEDQFSFGFKKNNRFHQYIKFIKEEFPDKGLPLLIEVMHRYIVNSGWNPDTDKLVLELATKDDWHKFIFDDVLQDDRFHNTNILGVLRKIIEQQIYPQIQLKIRNLIFEILTEEANKSDDFRKRNIEYVIFRLKEIE